MYTACICKSIQVYHTCVKMINTSSVQMPDIERNSVEEFRDTVSNKSVLVVTYISDHGNTCT